MVKINDIKYYGQWCHETDLNYHSWWYSIFDEKVYHVDELIEKFSFETYEEIEGSFGYIPLWKTDYIEIAKCFISQTNDKIAQKFLLKNDDDFFIEFYDYVTSNQNYFTRWWHEFEDDRLVKDAINWCKDNNIPFKK